MVHELKCWPEYYRAVESGTKTFEVRKLERPYKVGDTLLLREWDNIVLDYTGKQLQRTITYLLDMTYLPGDRTPHFSGYVVIGLDNPEMTALRASLAQVTRERDEAIKDLRLVAIEGCMECGVCAYKRQNPDHCNNCKDACNWRYHSLQEVQDGR